MTHIIMSGPIKPLTEAERVFAGLSIGVLEFDGETWLRVHKAANVLGLTTVDAWNHAQLSKWRFIHRPTPMNRAGHSKVVKYFAKADVVRTAERLKRKRK